MATAQTLISGVGPLPLSKKFTAEGDGDVLIFVSGSAWSGNTDQLIGMNVLLDGQAIWSSTVWTNESSSHKALVPVFIPTSLSFGDHILELEVVDNNTNTDINDNFNVTLIY